MGEPPVPHFLPRSRSPSPSPFTLRSFNISILLNSWCGGIKPDLALMLNFGAAYYADARQLELFTTKRNQFFSYKIIR